MKYLIILLAVSLLCSCTKKSTAIPSIDGNMEEKSLNDRTETDINNSLQEKNPILVSDELLYNAVLSGSSNSVEYYLKAGADANALVGEYSWPIIERAISLSWKYKDARIVELLLNYGASPTGIVDPWSKDTVLLHAVEYGDDKTYELVRLLLDKGAASDINTASSGGWTPIMLAAQRGEDKALQLLINNGGDVNKTADSAHYYGSSGWYINIGNECSGITALMLARTPECIQILLNAGAKVNAKDSEGRNALFFQCFFSLRFSDRGSEIISLLVNAGSYLYNESDDYCILFDVLSYGYIDEERNKIVEILRNAGCKGEYKRDSDIRFFYYDGH